MPPHSVVAACLWVLAWKLKVHVQALFMSPCRLLPALMPQAALPCCLKRGETDNGLKKGTPLARASLIAAIAAPSLPPVAPNGTVDADIPATSLHLLSRRCVEDSEALTQQRPRVNSGASPKKGGRGDVTGGTGVQTEEEEEEESLFKADAVNEEDPERDRATQV